MKEGEMLKGSLNQLTPLYPYDGRSSLLIDKFYIFGYNYLTLKKFLIDEFPKLPEESVPMNTLIPFQLEEEPSILTEVTNDFNKKMLNSESIYKLIFPNNVNFYYRIGEDINNPEKKGLEPITTCKFEKIDFSENRDGIPLSYRVIFSSNSNQNLTTRKVQNGFAYTFYRKFFKQKFFNNKKLTFYVPFTFCVISEFPFYKSFEDLFKCIRKIYSQESIYIPIEILLYKIIKLTPSPINTDIVLDLELICNQEKVFKNYKNDKGNIKIANTDKIDYGFNREHLNIEKEEEKEEFDDFKIIDKKDFIRTMKRKNKNEYKIKFKYLSGYPLIQYNLAKVLFKTLSIENIINIFLFTFLEENIIFFSENIEFLTLTLNAFASFNFPFNDMQYFFSLGAVSLDAFKKGDLFGVKAFSYLIGINNKYDPNYNNDKRNNLHEHIVIDLDKGDIITEEADEISKKVIKLINKICSKKSNKKKLEETILYKAINNLYKRLDKAFKLDSIYLNQNLIYCSDEPQYLSVEVLNKYIQEAFYDFVVNLSLYCYDNIKIKEDKNKKNKIKENNFYELNFDKSYKYERKYSDDELLILTELTGTMKFEGSFCRFVRDHDPMDLYKIPLTFTDEFISFLSNKRNIINTTKIKYFKLIDQLYLSKKDKDIKKIDFSFDIIKYLNNYKNKFNKELDNGNANDFDEDFSPIKIYDYNGEKILKYQTYELDDNILLLYNNIIFDLPERNNLELIPNNDNIVKKINLTEIRTILEKYSLNNKVLSNTELCISNIIILFLLSIKSLKDNIDCFKFLSVLLQNFDISRKYYSLLVNMVYELYTKSLEENNESKVNQLKFCFLPCISYIKKNNIIPDENIMNIINKMINSLEKEDASQKNEIRLEDDEIIESLDINECNLQVHNNFSYAQFYDEKFIIKIVNLAQKGDFNATFQGKKDKVSPKILFVKNQKEKIECPFNSQKVLLDNLTKEYITYTKNMNIQELNRDIIVESCLNIFVYIRNNDKFQQYYEIWKMLENIFYVFSK